MLQIFQRSNVYEHILWWSNQKNLNFYFVINVYLSVVLYKDLNSCSGDRPFDVVQRCLNRGVMYSLHSQQLRGFGMQVRSAARTHTRTHTYAARQTRHCRPALRSTRQPNNVAGQAWTPHRISFRWRREFVSSEIHSSGRPINGKTY